jgi:signal transduction histidine kinase
VILAALLIWWLSSLVEGWQSEANDQASRLSRANEALEQYASSAAHDLKAPARHVLLYGELLEEALGKNDIDTARRHARSIRESAIEMPKIIDGMLDYSRSAFTRISLSDNSLSELVQAAALQHASDLETTGAQHQRSCTKMRMQLRLHADDHGVPEPHRQRDQEPPPRQAAGHPHRWRARGNGHAAFQSRTMASASIPNFAAVAFNPLARGVHTAGEGTGIGLATCRTIIQSHGGEIRIDPNWRNGARVEFTLPDKPHG